MSNPILMVSRLAPGLAVTTVVGVLAWGLAASAARATHAVPLDAVVLALITGIVLRARWAPDARFAPGVAFAAKPLLEVAIVLLGVSADSRWITNAGAVLALAIVLATLLALGAGVAWGRAFGLQPTHALLVAAGNAICGNSAIAAVAAVTDAPREETAASIAYTAILSLALVLALPLARALWGLDDMQYGVATGLTVYAVPQVLAAAYPVSVQAGQVGTMVKLVRVLMLVPLVSVLAWRRHRRLGQPGTPLAMRSLVPWYVAAFLGAAVMRSLGVVPDTVARGAQLSSHALTVLAMAALGLGVDVADLRRVGWRTAAAATVSLLTLCAIAAAVVGIVVRKSP